VLNGKSILITGGTGSFGKAFVAETLRRYPNVKRLVIFSRDELKQYEMERMYPESEYPAVRFFLGDVRNRDRLKRALQSIDTVVHAAELSQPAILAAIRAGLTLGMAAFEEVVGYVAANAKSDIRAVFAGSVPYLMLAGVVIGGWNMARAALVAQAKVAGGDSAPFLPSKIATARFYADHVMPRAISLRIAIVAGAPGVLALADEAF